MAKINHRWTAEDDAILHDMLSKGASMSQVGEAMGLGYDSVRARIRTLRGRNDTANKVTIWTADMDDMLRQLAAVTPKLTTYKMGKRIGVSRHAVQRRLKLLAGYKPKPDYIRALGPERVQNGADETRPIRNATMRFAEIYRDAALRNGWMQHDYRRAA
jgi:hypothetical protein